MRTYGKQKQVHPNRKQRIHSFYRTRRQTSGLKQQ